MSPGRFLATVYAVVFLALSAFAGVSILQTHQELETLRVQAAASRERLLVAERELHEQQRTLARLRSDPQFVESMIRRKLGYARPGEMLFRFPD